MFKPPGTSIYLLCSEIRPALERTVCKLVARNIISHSFWSTLTMSYFSPNQALKQFCNIIALLCTPPKHFVSFPNILFGLHLLNSHKVVIWKEIFDIHAYIVTDLPLLPTNTSRTLVSLTSPSVTRWTSWKIIQDWWMEKWCYCISSCF